MPLPKLYTELADWWPVLSAPGEYAEEAEFYRRTIIAESPSSPKTLLELGSGGGNNASHMKAYFEMTLVDLSPGMLAVSKALNPECEHVEGDMRTLRLDRQFDAVFIHDAIHFMDSREDLEAAITTAWVHCRPGGLALFMPDHTLDTFEPWTSHGGHDVGDRSLRYLEWDGELDEADESFPQVMVYVMRDRDGTVHVAKDEYRFKLFSEQTWLEVVAAAGFEVTTAEYDLHDPEVTTLHAFIALKPESAE